MSSLLTTYTHTHTIIIIRGQEESLGGDGYVSIFITDFIVYSHITHKLNTNLCIWQETRWRFRWPWLTPFLILPSKQDYFLLLVCFTSAFLRYNWHAYSPLLNASPFGPVSNPTLSSSQTKTPWPHLTKEKASGFPGAGTKARRHSPLHGKLSPSRQVQNLLQPFKKVMSKWGIEIH